MSTPNRTIETVFTRMEQRRERNFLKHRAQTASWLPSFRNQPRRRLLVKLWTTGVIFMFFAAVLIAVGVLSDSAQPWLGLPWMLGTFAIMVVWIMLNITVDMIDSAPVACLDEYERKQVEGLRSFTYRVSLFLGLAGLLLLIFFGVWLMDVRPDWAAEVPYLVGIFATPVFLTITSLPTAVIAWNLTDID